MAISMHTLATLQGLSGLVLKIFKMRWKILKLEGDALEGVQRGMRKRNVGCMRSRYGNYQRIF